MPRQRKGATKPRRERMRIVLNLREGGATLAQISDKLGISVTQVAKDIDAALQEITRESAESLLTLESQRLDSLWRTAYAEAKKPVIVGDARGQSNRWKAMEQCVRIHERRCKLLGLGVIRVDVTAPTVDALAASFSLLDSTPVEELESALGGDCA